MTLHQSLQVISLSGSSLTGLPETRGSTCPNAKDLVDEALAGTGDTGDTAEIEDHFAEAVEVDDQALGL